MIKSIFFSICGSRGHLRVCYYLSDSDKVLLYCSLAVIEYQRASKSHHWFKSYSDFAECVYFCLLVELHRDKSAAAACAAGLFHKAQVLSCSSSCVITPSDASWILKNCVSCMLETNIGLIFWPFWNYFENDTLICLLFSWTNVFNKNLF